jgi:methylenetetrahydrofolate dehydrogenase (NADP+)/methenyltetrahydrofolate cyclohydrolase
MSNAVRIDGKAKAAELSEQITAETAALKEAHGIQPGLAVVIIGEDPASQVYVRNKGKRAESCGFYSVQHALDAAARARRRHAAGRRVEAYRQAEQ